MNNAMDVDGNFYDELAPFLSSNASDDYNLDDLEEILRSAGPTELSPPMELNECGAPFDDVMQNFSNKLCFDFFSADNTCDTVGAVEACADSRTTQINSQIELEETNTNSNSPRTSSTGSLSEEDNFNADDFLNLINETGFKTAQSPSADSGHGSQHHHHQRSTPSPTNSCTGSIDSSASSGIQSDVAAVDQISQFESMETVSLIAPLPNSILPLTLPTNNGDILPASSTTQIPAAAGFSLLSGTLIPVKAMPVTAIAPLTAASIKPPTSTPATLPKLEPKLAPKPTIAKPVTIKVNAIKPAIVNKSAQINKPYGKVTLPTNTNTATTATGSNGKPKTVYLSANDFKALMQKMNSNGQGAKINGSIKPQLPKIVLKNANGQVIVDEKLKANTQFVPKIVKQSQLPVGKLLHGAAESETTGTSPNINVYKGIVDERTYKKQQRMIKNRESASMSRKKKKEYVVSLESRISDLEKQNITLKGENNSLRSQLVAFAQTCQCKHSNISEFILNSLSITSEDSISCLNEQQQHVRIAPKSTGRGNLKQRMLSTSVKKNVAILFALAFMVTFNFGKNYHNYLNGNSLEGLPELTEEAAAAAGAVAGAASAAAPRHTLLWVEGKKQPQQPLSRSKRDTELQVPPLHFLRPSTRATLSKEAAVKALAAESESVATQELRHANTSASAASKCALSSNQTENMRLASSLHKWIDGNDYLNLSARNNGKFAEGYDKHVGFKIAPSHYFKLNDAYDLPLQAPPVGAFKQKQRYFERAEHAYSKPERRYEFQAAPASDTDSNSDSDSSLGIYKPKISEEYMRLFEGIKRQDDTFYVLSFNMDHILLPASHYNKSSRPKMALMLPAGDPALNGDVVLMQIDCEVVNTTELQLKAHEIPKKLRPTGKYATQQPSNAPDAKDVAVNETKEAFSGAGKAGRAAAKANDDSLAEKNEAAAVAYNRTAVPPAATTSAKLESAKAFKRYVYHYEAAAKRVRSENVGKLKSFIVSPQDLRNSTYYEKQQQQQDKMKYKP